VLRGREPLFGFVVGGQESGQVPAQGAVIALLYDRGSTPTINHDLARPCNSSLPPNRADSASCVAPVVGLGSLGAPGLRLIRTHGEGSIVPAHDHTATRAALTQAQSESTPTTINLDAYKATYQVLKAPDAKRASAHADTQKQAQDRARQIVHNAGGGEVVTHGRDGQIRDSDTIAPGNDPNPPRDKK